MSKSKKRIITLTDLQIFRLAIQKYKHNYKEHFYKDSGLTSIAVAVENGEVYSVSFSSKNDDRFAFVNLYSPNRDAYFNLFDILNPNKSEPEPCQDCQNHNQGESNE